MNADSIEPYYFCKVAIINKVLGYANQIIKHLNEWHWKNSFLMEKQIIKKIEIFQYLKVLVFFQIEHFSK